MKDVFVIGYPKSGVTWLTRLVAEVLRAPVAGFWKQGKWHHDIASIGTEDRQSYYRVFKAHHTLPDLRRHLVPWPNPARMIYIVRDPRDIAFSARAYFSHHSAHLPDATEKEVARIIRDGERPDLDLVPWAMHVNQYVEGYIPFVRYEHLLKAPRAYLAEVLRRIGLETTVDQIDAAVRAQEFSAKKAELLRGHDDEAKRHMRIGKDHQYEAWQPADLKEITNWFEPTLFRLGYT